MMLVSELLDQCAEIEDRVGELYDEFATTFRDDCELATFWSEMAREERAHASSLRTAAASPSAGARSLDAGTFVLIRSYVTALTGWRSIATLDEALRTALDVEELELDVVHAKLMEIVGEAPPCDPSADDEHVDLLLRMIERRGSSRRLRTRAAADRRRGRESKTDLSIQGLLAVIAKRICYPDFRG